MREESNKQVPVGWFRKLFRSSALVRQAEQWRLFEKRYRELTEEDTGLREALFGREFERAYFRSSAERAGR